MRKRVFGHMRTAKVLNIRAKSDHGIHCPQTESSDTTECMNAEQRHGSYFAHTQMIWLCTFCVYSKARFRLTRPTWKKHFLIHILTQSALQAMAKNCVLFCNKVTGGRSQLKESMQKQSDYFKLYHSMGKFSRRQVDDIFLLFFFPENRLWHFMQFVSWGDNLH